MEHATYMQRCLELASLGLGQVAPNPMVGCVIVHDGKIIGEGYHQACGQAHAEVNAISSVEDESLLPHSALYVNLEPCAHFGKTPPCADLILEVGIPMVYIACSDPFAEVAGRGIVKLKQAGVHVEVGVLERPALELNKRFFTFHQKKRPYVILKWAETSDGFVDCLRADRSTPPLRITGDTAKILSHQWRAEECAILTGANTAKLDNPYLTVRSAHGKNPIRIVIDRDLSLSPALNLFNADADTIIINELKDARQDHLQWTRVASVADMKVVIQTLWSDNIQSVLVEGGPSTQHELIRVGLWDEVRRYVSPKNILEGVRAPVLDIASESEISVGDDRLLTYRNQNP